MGIKSSDMLQQNQPHALYSNPEVCSSATPALSMYGNKFGGTFDSNSAEIAHFKEYQTQVHGAHWSGFGDIDRAWYFRKGEDCWISFMGSDSQTDFMNNFNWFPTSWNGVHDVHAGVVQELDPLVELMREDFPMMRNNCTGELTVTGHSLGGALAQLFSLAVNHHGDPLQTGGLTVHKLYTFGAMSAIDWAQGLNNKTEDNCFAGAQIYYADQNSDGIPFTVDVVASEHVTGGHHDPLRSDKYFVVPANLQFSLPPTFHTFQCGHQIPEAIPLSGSTWLFKHGAYLPLLGCPFSPPPAPTAPPTAASP